ncbi:hypothetical protein [Halotia branconii]|uniref:Uncharacterized protein n=1 Tax=Halotia branconii CENA392 TaxID=1539056 RepID=A0AAJ6NMY8_9CYAN|nr:hypothetical protein [Halotia branconii]WGV23319.1 hypothetical protein QI031_15950 [Halotia branconii CENA392]
MNTHASITNNQISVSYYDKLLLTPEENDTVEAFTGDRKIMLIAKCFFNRHIAK